MKNKKGLTIAAGILLILLAIYGIIKKLNVEEESTETETVQNAYEADAADITELTIESNGNQYDFKHADDKWTYTGDSNFPLSESSFLNIVSSITSIQADRILEDTEDMTEFGLENPEVKVTVKTESGQDVLKFGDVNSGISGCYMVKNEETDKVYIVDAEVKSALQFELKDLAEKESIPSITGSTIQNVRIDKNGQTLNIGKDSTSETGWSLTGADGTKTAADTSKVSDYMDRFSTLAWSEYVTYDKSDLAAYGLDNPVKVTVDYQVTETVEKEDTEEKDSDKDESTDNEETAETVTVDKQAVFLIGSKKSKSDYYAQMEGNHSIYTMLSSNVEEMIELDENDFVSTLVSDYSFADLDRVTFEKDGTTYIAGKKEVEKEDSNENGEQENSEEDDKEVETIYTINDKEVDQTAFSSFFNKINSMEWQSRDNSLQPEGKPEFTAQFEKENGVNFKTEYYSYDANFYLVVDSKGNHVLVNKMKVKDMLETFDDIIEEWKKE